MHLRKITSILLSYRSYRSHPHITNHDCDKHNKKDPKKDLDHLYAHMICKALTFFPELKTCRIYFVVRKVHQFPLSSKPDRTSLIRPYRQRTYIITIGSSSDQYFEPLLFKHLSPRAQLGIIGHELSHIVDYERQSTRDLIGFGIGYLRGSYRTRVEQRTDRIAIQHGLGKQLKEYAQYAEQLALSNQHIAHRRIHYLTTHQIQMLLDEHEHNHDITTAHTTR